MATTVNVLCYKSKTLSNGEYFVILSTAKNLKASTLYLQILHTPSLLSRLSGGNVQNDRAKGKHQWGSRTASPI